MDNVKDIVVKVVPSTLANDFVKKHHYSGKVVNNSQLHFGVFLNGILGGVMSYWPSTDKSKLIHLVQWTQRNEFIELNRMAFSDLLPRNSESRALAISIKLLKKKAPQIKRIVSFADACQCWDGTIYRASWFELKQIAEKKDQFYILPNGESFTTITVKLHWYSGGITKYITKQKFDSIMGSQLSNVAHLKNLMAAIGAKAIDGYSIRYIKLLKPNLTRNYNILPYSSISEMGASMYKGVKKVAK